MSGTCSHRADSSKRCTSSTLVTTQMLTQMLLAMVSLCVLCETTVRSWPCAQLLRQRAPDQHAPLDEVGVARWRSTQREPKSIMECSFRLFKVLYPH